MSQAPNHRNGYSLVELLVVIAIILFLTSLILGAALGVRNYAYGLQTKAKLEKIASSIRAFSRRYSSLPNPDFDFQYYILSDYATGEQINIDEWGFEIRYERIEQFNSFGVTTSSFYTLYSVGPDGKPHTWDDIVYPIQ